MIYGGLTDELTALVQNCTTLKGLPPTDIDGALETNFTNINGPKTSEQTDKTNIKGTLIRTTTVTRILIKTTLASTIKPELTTQIALTEIKTPTMTRTTLKITSLTTVATTITPTRTMFPSTVKPMRPPVTMTTKVTSTATPNESKGGLIDAKKDNVVIKVVGHVKMVHEVEPLKIETIKEIKKVKNAVTKNKDKETDPVGSENKLQETKNFNDLKNGEKREPLLKDDDVQMLETTEIPLRKKVQIEEFGNVKPRPFHSQGNGIQIKTWKLREKQTIKAKMDYLESGDISASGNSVTHLNKKHLSKGGLKKYVRSTSNNLSDHLSLDNRTPDRLHKSRNLARVLNSKPNHSEQVQPDKEILLEFTTRRTATNGASPLDAAKTKRNLFSVKTAEDVLVSQSFDNTDSPKELAGEKSITSNNMIKGADRTERSISVIPRKNIDTTSKYESITNSLTNVKLESIKKETKIFGVTRTKEKRMTKEKRTISQATDTTNVTVIIDINTSNTTDVRITNSTTVNAINVTNTRKLGSNLTFRYRDKLINTRTNINLASANTLCPSDKEVEQKMKKYALYYIYAALVTLVCAYGELVCWSVAAGRAVNKVNTELSEDIEKGPGSFDSPLRGRRMPSFGTK